MLLEFNKFEKRVGLFLVLVFAGLLVLLVYIGYTQKWFAPKVTYYATYQKADGLRSGTQVNVAGIAAGKVVEVELDDNNKIKVKIKVLKRFSEKIREDSVAKIVRPFVIGDKVIDITIGSKEKKIIPFGEELASQDSMELIDLISGGNMGPYLETLSNALNKFKNVLDMLLEDGDEKQVVDLINEVLPTIRSIRKLSDALSGKDMKVFLKEGGGVMTGMNKTIDKINIEKLVNDLSSLVVVLNNVSSKLPEITTKGLKALDEGIWVLKGMQKSWFLKSHIEEIHKEEEKKGKKHLYIKISIMAACVIMFIYSIKIISDRIHPRDRKSSEECFKELKNTLPKDKLIDVMQKKTITQSYCDFIQ